MLHFIHHLALDAGFEVAEMSGRRAMLQTIEALRCKRERRKIQNDGRETYTDTHTHTCSPDRHAKKEVFAQ